MHQLQQLEKLSARLTEWRRKHKAPTPIPREVWSSAATLAGEMGVSKVATALRLDHNSLRRRVVESTEVVRSETRATFVEFSAIAPESVGECSIDIETNRGHRAHFVMKNVAASSLLAIVRELVN